jgi:hypothetical protein
MSESNATINNLATSDITASRGELILKVLKSPTCATTKKLPPSSHAVTYPDGGLTAWLSILGVWLTFFATFGYVSNIVDEHVSFKVLTNEKLTSFGVYQDYYTRLYLSNKTPSDIIGLAPFSRSLWACLPAY